MDTSEESYFSSADEDEDAQQAQQEQARRPPMLSQPLGLKLRLEAQQAQHVEAGAAALRSHALARRQAAGEEAGVDMGTGMAAGAAGAGMRDGEAALPHSPAVNGRVEMSVSPSLGPRPLAPLVDYGDDEEDELPMKGGLWPRCAHAVPLQLRLLLIVRIAGAPLPAIPPRRSSKMLQTHPCPLPRTA